MDFSTRDVSVLSKQGVVFDILDIMPGRVGEPTGAQVKLLGAESPEFSKADDESQKQLMVLQQGKKVDKASIQKLSIKRLAACTVELINCYIGKKQYSTDKADIEEFYAKFPFVYEQMEAKLVSRSAFLQNAEEPTSAT